MNNDLTVAALPMDITLGDIKANLATVANAMETLPGDVDLVVLPELFSTGFIEDAQRAAELAEPLSGDTVAFLGSLARKYHVAVAGSYLARTASKLYNRAFFIEPGGDETYYDKRHLFCLSPESQLAQPGESQSPIVHYRGWDIAMAVCYDLRFPVWCRSTASHRYDLLLVPANWPDVRQYAWHHLLVARAIENQAAVVGANRGGQDKFGTYDNTTEIIDPMGKSIGRPLAGTPFITARLSHEALTQYRRRFPVMRDADTFTIDFCNG